MIYSVLKTQCGLQLPIHSSIKIQAFAHPSFLAGAHPGIHMLQVRLKPPIKEQLGPAEEVQHTAVLLFSKGFNVFGSRLRV